MELLPRVHPRVRERMLDRGIGDIWTLARQTHLEPWDVWVKTCPESPTVLEQTGCDEVMRWAVLADQLGISVLDLLTGLHNEDSYE